MSTMAQTPEPAKTEAQSVKREDPAPPKSSARKFELLQVGMSTAEINQILGRSPDDYHTYETGKRWFIPFYFGNDAVRLQAHYKGEGCLTFSVGFRFQNHGTEWEKVEGDLREITIDPSGDCYKP